MAINNCTCKISQGVSKVQSTSETAHSNRQPPEACPLEKTTLNWMGYCGMRLGKSSVEKNQKSRIKRKTKDQKTERKGERSDQKKRRKGTGDVQRPMTHRYIHPRTKGEREGEEIWNHHNGSGYGPGLRKLQWTSIHTMGGYRGINGTGIQRGSPREQKKKRRTPNETKPEWRVGTSTWQGSKRGGRMDC